MATGPGQPAQRRRRGHGGAVRADEKRRGKGLLGHLQQPGSQCRQPPAGDRRPAPGRTGDYPGCLPRHRDQPLRRHPATGCAVGRRRGRDDQQRAQPHPHATCRRTARAEPARLADHRPGRLRHGLCRRLRLPRCRGGVRGDPPLSQPNHRLRPAGHRLCRTARAAAPVALRPGPRQPAQPAALSQRRQQPGAVARCPGRVPGVGLPDRQRQGPLLRPALVTGGGAAGCRVPHGAEYRPRAAPVAHPDQDRQGTGAEQAGARPLRGNPPRRCCPAGHCRKGPGGHSLAPRAGRATRANQRPGHAWQLLCPVPLERPDRRATGDQRRDLRCGRPAVAAACLQTLRRSPGAGRR
ncbi:hypothetical protein D3C75_550700 [compost metagenome]